MSSALKFYKRFLLGLPRNVIIQEIKIVNRGGVHNHLIFSDLGLFSFWQDPSDQ